MTMILRLTKEEKEQLKERLDKMNGDAEITLELVGKINGKKEPDQP